MIAIITTTKQDKNYTKKKCTKLKYTVAYTGLFPMVKQIYLAKKG